MNYQRDLKPGRIAYVRRQTVPFEGFITFILVSLGVFAFMLYMLHTWANTPTVYWSHSTGACLKVWDPVADGKGQKRREFNCENLPPRYENKWTD